MKSKKAIALIISLTLIVSMTLPGTLAVSEDQAAALDSYTLAEEKSAAPTSEEQACTCGTETGVHTEACAQYTAPEAPAVEEKTCTCGMTDGTHTEECPLYTAPEAPANEEKTCTCDPKPAEGEPHKVGCPLYTAPKEPAGEEKTCTCDPKPAEGEPHKEGCPLYEEQTEPAETEVEIKYQVVGPENSGTLDTASETLLLPVSGTENGSEDRKSVGRERV